VVKHAASPTRIAHVDDDPDHIQGQGHGLLKFQNLLKIALFYVYLLCHYDVELKTDG